MLRQRIVAPSYAIAEAWLDNTAELDDESKTAVVGRIWLAPSWNQSHRVKLTTQRKTESIVLHTLHGSRFFRHELPIEGEVMVLTKSPPQQIASVVTAMVKPRLPEMIAAASENFPESREQLEGYRWILWLLDVAAGLIPNVKAVDNSLVDPPRILSELNTRGAIWYAASGGDADGAFPDQPHGFMLRADQAPVLIDVLRERLKQPVLKRLGGHVSTAPVTTPSTATAEASQQPATEKAAQREAADDPSRRSWFRSALGSITAMWSADDDDTNDDGEVIEATPAHPLALLLHRELLALSMPRHDIDIEPGGKRAVDYSKRKSRIVLNADHPAVQAVSGDDPPAPALASLIAAIIGEINRAHKNITAVDEQQALLKLLDGG